MRKRAPNDPIDPSQFASSPSAPQIDRQFGRQLFRELIKMQIEDGPLRRSQRRELITFARRLGIDTFEARLIIRAVEYECGVAAPAAMDDRETDANTHFVTRADDSLAGTAQSLMAPVLILVAILLIWAIAT